jgi:hypothetical protein
MSRVASRFLVVVMATLLATGWLTARPGSALAVATPISLTSGSPYVQDFDTLVSTGSSSTLPAGWDLSEAGTNANTQYTAGTGSSTTGDTYSFGGSGSSERAFGTLQSGSLVPIVGAGFSNDTGAAITGLQIAYFGEMWRLGVTDRGAADQLDFQLSTDATSLTSGTWTSYDALDFLTPAPTGTSGARDGNNAQNRTSISASIAGLSIPAGATFWLRWTDFNISSSDDGLAIDDFSLTPTFDGAINLSVNDISQNEGNSGSGGFLFTVSLSAPAGAGGVTFDVSTADGTAESNFSEDYSATTLPDETIPEGQTSTSFSIPVTGDTTFEPDETFFVDVTGVTGATVADGQGLGTILNDDAAPCGDEFTPIYSIQGSGASAAITGNVITEGIVVGDFEGAAVANGFYIQDPTGDGNAATSDGLFVFTGANASAVNVGDLVRVTGFARERFNQTALNGSNSNSSPVTDIVPCGTGTVAATDISLPFASLTFPERYEGMLVRFLQPLVIAEYFNYDRFGEMVLALPLDGETRPFTGTAIDEPGAAANARTLANQLRRITLDDNQSTQNPPTLRHPNGNPFSLTNLFRGGDRVQNAVGVLGFDFSLYRIFPTGPADYTALNPRPLAPEDPGGSLKVAAMNTLNFFLTLDTTASDTGPGPCGGNANLDCRGADADQPNEFTRQRDKLLQALAGLNADVLGLNELENTPGVDPLADPVNGIVPGLNAILAAGTYAAINTGTIGTDAIKVGLIYKPSVVTPVGGFQILDSTDDPRFIDTKSRPALAQTFEEIATGARFTVVVNHLKSKGSACTDVGDPDAGDGQGNCNGTRTLAAQALVDWIATDPTGSGDPDFLIMGDLNSYAMEDPIDAIKVGSDDTAGTSDDWTNLIAQSVGTYAYSFVFDGQAGYLDHALANASIVGQVTGATEWHINADEPDVLDYDTTFKPASQEALYEPNQYRTSDHDPLTVGLDLVNLAPTIAIVRGGSCGTTSGAISVSVNDPDGHESALTLSVTGNSNPAVVPNSNVTFGGSGASRTVNVAAGSQSGSASLTISVSDGFNSAAVAFTVVVGSSGADSVSGTSGTDLLLGLAGEDILTGLGGMDVVCGGKGEDALSGGDGDDTIDGGIGDDVLLGGDGNDLLRGGGGDDQLYGESGDDTLTGNSGADWFSGGPGTDVNTDLDPIQGDATDGT